MNRPKYKEFRAILIMLIAFAISIGILNNNVRLSNKRNIPKAQNGVLDLRGWDFEKNGMIPLNGQWDFYYGKFINPDEFTTKNIPEKTGEINIPGNFNGYKYKDKKLDGNGFATYKLKVITDKKESYYSIKTEFILTAHKLWAGGEVVSLNGVLGENKSSMVPQLLPETGTFYSNSEEFDIVLQVANFHTRTAQIDDILMGTKNKMLNYDNGKIGFDFFLLGSTLIMAIYHFGLYFKRRKYKAPLYFGVLCAIISLRTIFIGERFFVRIFPNFNFIIYMKLCYLTFFMYIPFLILFIESFYPNTISKKILKLSNISGIMYLILVIILPISAYDVLIFPFEIISLLLLLYAIYMLIIEYYNDSFQYKFIIFSILLLVMTRINDILYEYSIIQTASYAVLGLLIFIIAQSYVLAGRFSMAFSSIEEMTEKLKLADILKDDFLAVTSHELKTPLNGIIGLTELLISSDSKNLSKEELHNIRLINSSAQRLTNLVNDILDFLKLKNNDIVLHRTPIDLKQTVQIVHKFLENSMENKFLIFNNEIPKDLPLIYADENRVQQILYNLIGNAIKFTATGSITISAIKIGEFIEITITDTGIGIAKERQDEVFLPYRQATEEVNKKYGGTGLGLSITKKLVELHGGSIKVQSELKVGSKFKFTIPLTRNLKEVAIKPSLFIEDNSSHAIDQENFMMDSKYTPGKYRILIVDDSPINIKVLENFLVNEDYSIVSALDGEEALEILKFQPEFDLVILDMMMPDMLGYEVCEVIRETYSIFQLPVIMMTGSNRREYLTLSFKSGVNDFLTKPFDKIELLVRVKTLITLKHSVQNAIELQNTIELAKKQVDNLHQSFEEKNKELSQMIEYDKFKTDFFVNISHELRTPLNVISGTVQLLKALKGECLVSDNNIQHYLNSMNKNCLRLIRLTNNLIDSIRIDGNFLALNLITGNVIYVVEEITLSVADYVKNKGMTLIFDTDIEEKLMSFDQDKIERVILNLLSNAIKFTKDKGSIWVSVFDLGDNIKISVKDNGIGIPPENLNKIFHRFTQVDSSLSRSKEGSGIGLALVKSLVELHGGNIKVNSEVGKGSEFIIELPAKILKESSNSSVMYDAGICENSEKISIEFSDIYT